MMRLLNWYREGRELQRESLETRQAIAVQLEKLRELQFDARHATHRCGYMDALADVERALDAEGASLRAIAIVQAVRKEAK